MSSTALEDNEDCVEVGGELEEIDIHVREDGAAEAEDGEDGAAEGGAAVGVGVGGRDTVGDKSGWPSSHMFGQGNAPAQGHLASRQ